jgi:hypothetical protein
VKLGQQIGEWGITNSKPPGRIITTGQSETLSRSLIIFITLFSAGGHICCVFHKPLQRVHFCWAKINFFSQTAYFGFPASNFTVQDHILSTAGDALTTLHFWYHCAQNGVIQHCWHNHSTECPFAVAIESKFCCRGLSIDKCCLHLKARGMNYICFDLRYFTISIR